MQTKTKEFLQELAALMEEYDATFQAVESDRYGRALEVTVGEGEDWSNLILGDWVNHKDVKDKLED